MHTRTLLIAALVLGGLLLGACAAPTAGRSEPPVIGGGAGPAADGVETVHIAPELMDCEGVGPMRCMQVAASPAGPWELFYAEIEGFSFEPGYSYELRVRKEQVANPPADGSSLRYILEELVSKTPAASAPDAGAGLAGSSWVLSDLEGAAPVGDAQLTLEFDAAGRLAGSAGCNRYSGGYSDDGATLAVGPLISTQMACDGVMEQEARYLALLGSAASYTLAGDTLTITTAAGETVTYARA